MTIHLINIDQFNHQLNEQSCSMFLGVFHPQNHIQNFLKLACCLLHLERAYLVFHQEPYLWAYSASGFQAYQNPNIQHNSCFQNALILTEQHPYFEDFSAHLSQLGLKHQRLAVIDLKLADESLGYVILADELFETLDAALLDVLAAQSSSLLHLIEKQRDNMLLKELYEHETSINWSKTKYLQILAHDLRAPFHGLLGFTDVLVHERDTLNEAETQRIVEYLNDTTLSTFNLLESVLNWAMADGGRFVYHPISFKLFESAAIVTEVLQGLAQKKNIRLINQVNDAIQVFADINMVTSVIQNLVSNALKFTNADCSGEVIISAETEQDVVHIYIKDNGLGMNAKQLENLFEPKLVVSVHGTAGESGAGLGLILCKRFVDLNLGKISVKSTLNQGTEFKVSLPASILKSAKTAAPV